MLDQNQRKIIVDSFRLVVPIANTAADLFYRRLFELRPKYRDLFPPDMQKQKQKLITMLAFVVNTLDFADADWRETIDEKEDLFLVLLALGRRHSELYRVTDDMYEPVGEALMWALDYGLGKAFTADARSAWLRAYRGIAQLMRMGRYSVMEQQEVAGT